MRLGLRADHPSGDLWMCPILARVPPYKRLTELPPSTKILDTWKLPMSMVTIKASLCRKCTTNMSESENKIGLLGASDGLVSTMGYLLRGPP